MTLDSFDLKLIKYLQEKNQVSLPKAAQAFHRTPSSIRRQIEAINYHLRGHSQIHIKNNTILAPISYHDYLNIIQRLTPLSYLPSRKERMQTIIVKAFFQGVVNLSQMYTEFGYSPSTKKSDTQKLRILLNAYGLDIEIAKKKGIRIVGEELLFRMLVVEILLPLVELDAFRITSRRANTPFQTNMVSFSTGSQEYLSILEPLATHIFQHLQAENLSYQSRKLLFLYLLIFINRKEDHMLTPLKPIILPVMDFQFLADYNENVALLRVLSMLDFDPYLKTPFHEEFFSGVEAFFNASTTVLSFTPHNRTVILEELYQYFYKVYFRNYYNIQIKDKMVRDTDQKFLELYRFVRQYTEPIGRRFSIGFNAEHCTTLALILKKWIDFNQISGVNRKKIVLVTNTSSERSSFFIATLKKMVEFELLSILAINEITKLTDISFDYIVTLSDRTADLLQEMGFPSLRLEFFLETEDLDKLLSVGFSAFGKRIRADGVAQKIQGLSPKDITDYLCKTYPEYFL